MRLNKIYISVYLIILIGFIITISVFAYTILTNVNNMRMQELYNADVDKFKHIQTIIEYVDEKTKSACVTQFLNKDNIALMYANKYNAIFSNSAITSFNNYIFADEDIQSAYIYNNFINKYFGIAVVDLESGDVLNKIKEDCNGDLPKLKPIPRKMARYNSENYDNVLSYIIYEDLAENNMPSGAVIMNVKFDRIIKAARQASGKSRIIIIDNNGRIVADTFEKTDFLSKLDENILTAAKRSFNNGELEFCNLDGEKKVVNSFNIENIGWTYINVINYNDYFSTIRDLENRVIFMTILFIIIASIATIYIAKLITSPLNDFIKRITSIGKYNIEKGDKSKKIIPIPTALLKDYFSDAEINFNEHFKLYARGQRNEHIRNNILFDQNESITIKGYLVM